MTRLDPIEMTTRYATTVSDLPGAWEFVMDHLEKVGPDPSVEISPAWQYGTETLANPDPKRVFTVVVSGMVEQQAEGH